MSIRYSRLAVAVAALLALASLGSRAQSAEPARKPAKDTKGPVKVFLLVGQSNMQGKGSLNLVLFIRDIRKHLEVPNLPIVIGLVGHGGDKPNAAGEQLRKAQAAPAAMPEFKGTVAAVPTAAYWDATVRYDGGYHYNGSARFYHGAGEAFGKAMLELLKTADK